MKSLAGGGPDSAATLYCSARGCSRKPTSSTGERVALQASWPYFVNTGEAPCVEMMTCPDGVCAVCRAGAVQPGVRLPPRLQPHQRELQAGLPAAGEQVGGHLPPTHQPEGACSIPWPTLGTETQIHHLCCTSQSCRWWWLGTWNVPFCQGSFAAPQLMATALNEVRAGSACEGALGYQQLLFCQVTCTEID